MPDLSQLPLTLAEWSVAYFAIVAVHECGHYFAGLAIGVTTTQHADSIVHFPAACRTERWERVGQPCRYRSLHPARETFMPTTATALLFVAGGFILETAGLLIWAAFRLPFYRVTRTLAFWMTVMYLAFDVFVY